MRAGKSSAPLKLPNILIFKLNQIDPRQVLLDKDTSILSMRMLEYLDTGR